MDLPLGLAEVLLEASIFAASQASRAFRLRSNPRARRGRTLRPGIETPLWNALRAQLRPHVRRRGSQARLARLLGLPRQRVNAYLTGGREMPDAERVLQLLAWLSAVRRKIPPT